MATATVPVQTTLGIEEFSGGEITVPISSVINGIFLKRSDGTFYTTQRPSIDVAIDASVTVSAARGRGVTYWKAVDADYFVNDNKVYQNTYSTEVNEAAVTVSGLTGTGTTATATAAAHGYKTGDKVTIASSGASYNGEYSIIVTSPGAFTFLSAATASETGTAVRGLGGGGTERIFFLEIGNYLMIVDPEDNTGWYINSASPTTLVEIVDVNFPGFHSTGSQQLARCGIVLNGVSYVMDTTGSISGSDLEDPTNWDVLNFINAEIETDGGVALGIHRNHIAAFGNRTIEFFYDAANPVGSPLAVRQDISHEIGMANFSTLWGDQNSLFFVAQTKTGGLSVYEMREFIPNDITNADIDTFLTSAVQTDSKKLVGSGFSVGHTLFYVLTVYHLINSEPTSLESIVYNSGTGTWTRFELMHTGIDNCPIIDWTVANALRIGKGILSNGDVITVADDWSPYDTIGVTSGVFLASDTVFEADVFTSASAGSGTAVSMEIITGHTNNGTANTKFMSSLRFLGPKTKASQTLTVQWSNEDNESYNTGKTIDTSLPGRRITRLGSYRQRNFKLTIAATEAIEIDALEVDIAAGVY